MDYIKSNLNESQQQAIHVRSIFIFPKFALQLMCFYCTCMVQFGILTELKSHITRLMLFSGWFVAKSIHPDTGFYLS